MPNSRHLVDPGLAVARRNAADWRERCNAGGDQNIVATTEPRDCRVSLRRGYHGFDTVSRAARCMEALQRAFGSG